MSILTEFYYLMIIAVVFGLFFYGLHRSLRRQDRLHAESNLQQLLLLRALTSDLQKHRGLTSAVLNGDASMTQDMENIRQRVNQHIATAESCKSTHKETWLGIIDHWSRMREGRSQDTENNLKQHNLIIRNCIFLMEDIACEVDLTQGKAELAYLTCIWREVIPAAEWVGQARALGASIAATGYSSPAQRVRLQFLYEKIEQLSGDAFHTLQSHLAAHPETTGFQLQKQEVVMAEFLTCIKSELLSTASPGIDAKSYFKRATESIDALFALVDIALHQVQSQKLKY